MHTKSDNFTENILTVYAQNWSKEMNKTQREVCLNKAIVWGNHCELQKLLTLSTVANTVKRKNPK